MWIRWRQEIVDADSRCVADIFRGSAEGTWPLPGGFWSLGRHSRINFVQVCLETILGLFGQPCKFDSHAHSGITSSNHCGPRNVFFLDPKVCLQSCSHSQRHDGLNITTVATYVSGIHSHGRVDTFVPQFQREGDSVTDKLSTIVMPRSQHISLHVQRQLRSPWTVLTSH